MQQWRGWYESSIGRYQLGRQLLMEAITAAEASGNGSALAWASGQLAWLSLRMGDVVAALEHGSRAERLFDSQGDVWGAATTRLALGEMARKAGVPDEARRAWGDALTFYERERYGLAIQQVHESLAQLALDEGRLDEAQREMDLARVTAIEYETGGWEVSLAGGYLELALQRGELNEAVRILEPVVVLPQQPVRRYGTLIRVAEVQARRGLLDSAQVTLAAAVDGLETWRSSLEDDQLRLHAFDLDEAEGGSASVIAELAAQGRASAALAFAEHQRSRVLLDRMLQAVPTGLTDDRVDDERTSEQLELGRPLTAENLQRAIPDERTALLEYVTGPRGDPTTLFVVSRDGVSAYVLPSIESLRDQIDRMSRLIETGSEASWLAAELGETLLGPALAELPEVIDRLVIIPDGALHRLPFDALAPGGTLVLDRFATTLAPSGTVAAQLWDRPRRPAGVSSVLALGDPTFDAPLSSGSGESDVFRAAFDVTGGLERLVGSGREARRVADFARQSELRLRGEASEAFLKTRDLRPFSVVHLATHALVHDQSVTRATLALSPGDGEDGFLSPGELAALDLDADLVVLSACRTAGGVLVRGEGVQGLTAPLLQAGARSVAATRWPIGDRSTVRLVEDFYQRLAEGTPAGDALREAKLAARARGAPASEWAAFTLVGDGSVRVALDSPGSGSARLWAALLSLLLAGAIVGGWRRSRR